MRRKIGIMLLSLMLAGACACTDKPVNGGELTPEATLTPQAGDVTGTPQPTKTEELTPVPTSKEPAPTEDATPTQETTPQPTEEPTPVPTDVPQEVVELLHPEIITKEKSSFLDGDMVVEYYRSMVFLPEEDRIRFPELARALDEENAALEEGMTSSFEDLREMAAEYRENVGDEFEAHFYQKSTDSIVRADSCVLSIQEAYEDYLGGVHGYHGCFGFNYDARTGKKLGIWDILNDRQQTKSIVKEKLDARYGEEWYIVPIDETLDAYLSGESEFNFLVDYDGITIVFNPYEIASYAAGVLTVSIGYEEYPELFHEDYFRKPDSYVIPFSAGQEIRMDIDGDTVPDTICVYCDDYNEYDEPESTVICVNGVENKRKTYLFYIEEVYLIKAPGQKVYLYVFERTVNDYVALSVYDISDKTPVVCGEESDHNYQASNLSIQIDIAEDGSLYESVSREAAFTDPAHFWLTSGLDTLSTCTGARSYHLGEDGMPEADSESYEVVYNLQFTTLLDLEMTLVDEAGNESGTVIVKKGSVCKYYRTDAASWSDFILEDGSIGRVRNTVDGWPKTVNDMELEEVFEGIIFAG